MDAQEVQHIYAKLVQLEEAVHKDWMNSAHGPDDSEAKQILDQLIALHEQLPTKQIDWSLAGKDAAMCKKTADKITQTLNNRIVISGSNRIPLQPRFA